MEEVELLGPRPRARQRDVDVRRDVAAISRRPETSFGRRDDLATDGRVARAEERDPMPSSDEFIDQGSNDSLRAGVGGWRYRQHRWGEHRDPQAARSTHSTSKPRR